MGVWDWLRRKPRAELLPPPRIDPAPPNRATGALFPIIHVTPSGDTVVVPPDQETSFD